MGKDPTTTDNDMSDDRLRTAHALNYYPTQTAAAALGGLLRAGGSWLPGCNDAHDRSGRCRRVVAVQARSKAELSDIVV